MGESLEHLGQSNHVDPLKSSANLNVPMLPEGQPRPEHHLGSAKDPHPPRMLLRSQELYQPIPDRDYRENLYESPLPHRALLLLFLCTTKSLLTSFLAEGRRLPLSLHVNRDVTWRVAGRPRPECRHPKALQPPEEAGKCHRCQAASATRSRMHSPMGLRMRLQMGSRMG